MTNSSNSIALPPVSEPIAAPPAAGPESTGKAADGVSLSASAARADWSGWFSVRQNKEAVTVALIGALLGMSAFFMLGFGHVLWPRYVAWLLHGSVQNSYYDPSQQYIGWQFFRHAPWTLPVGKSTAYGMEFGSSIVYTDSTPLMALLFKPLSPLLGHDFQYHGIWILICYTLQGMFGGLLGRAITRRVSAGAVIAGFFAYSPVMVERSWTAYQHLPQWLVLWALLLYLTRQKTGIRWTWIAVTSLAAACNLYFVPMTLGIWAADLVRRTIGDFKSLISRWLILAMAAEIAVVLAALLFTMWFVGYFTLPLSGGETLDYGKYAINVLGPIDSWGSSWLMMPQPKSPMNVGEGYSYFGLGMIVLGLMALQELIAGGATRRAWLRGAPLLVFSVAITAFALSNHIAVGSWMVKTPPIWGKIGRVFRSSSRMFWPAYYAAWLAIFWLVTRRMGFLRSLSVLSIALALQLGEQWQIYKRMRDHYETTEQWTTPLTDPFWAAAAQRYRQVIVLPPGFEYPYVPVSLWADDHSMSLNGVYLGRNPDSKTIWDINNIRTDALRADHPDRQTLYIIPESGLYAALCAHLSKEHGVGRVDGYNAIAPYWFADGNAAGALTPGPLPAGTGDGVAAH